MNHRYLKAAVAALIVAAPPAMADTQQDTTYNYRYDYNGNRTQIKDPLQQVTDITYDSLNRVTKQLQPPPVTGAARPAINYTLDARDQMASVRDPRGLTTSYTVDGLGLQSARTSPDTGSAAKTYDTAGNLLTSTDARGKVTTYTYDVLSRVTRISYGGGVPTQFEYDGGVSGAPNAIGRLTKMIDESGQTSYSYDQAGRLLSKTQLTIAGGTTFTRTTSYAYRADGKLQSLTYPSGNRIDYDYDANGRVLRMTLTAPTGEAKVLLDNIQYAPFGAVQSWQWGNGGIVARTFDLDGRVKTYPMGSGLTRTLTYEAASRITAMAHTGDATAAAYNQSFGYDALNRLTSYTTATTSQSYSYDANGNRTQVSLGANTYSNTISTTSNRLASTSGPLPAKTNNFDAAGNLTGDGTLNYTYSNRGRMTSVTNAGVVTTYLYNGVGERVSKAGGYVPSGVNVYAYDGSGQLLGEYDAGSAPVEETVYLEGMPVAVVKSVDVYNVYPDHLGTPRVIESAATGAVVWRWDASGPFGMDSPNENPSGAGAFTYNQRFPGQSYDRESNLYYNYFRDYDPQIGRYIESDPIGLDGGINTYAYVGANPVNWTDPQGLNPATAAGAGIGTMVFPGPGTVVGAIVGTGIGIWIGYELTKPSAPMRSDKYAPGFIDAVEGSRRWGKRHGVRNAVDIFHDIKKGDRGRPGSKAGDDCSVNPETGDVNNGAGENIGNLGDGA
jgi:RHS repeat-associated protein